MYWVGQKGRLNFCIMLQKNPNEFFCQPSIKCRYTVYLRNTGAGRHFLLQGIFPIQGLNAGLLHCWWILYCLSHKGSPLSHLILILLGGTTRAMPQAHRTVPHRTRLALGLACRCTSELGLLCNQSPAGQTVLCDG